MWWRHLRWGSCLCHLCLQLSHFSPSDSHFSSSINITRLSELNQWIFSLKLSFKLLLVRSGLCRWLLWVWSWSSWVCVAINSLQSSLSVCSVVLLSDWCEVPMLLDAYENQAEQFSFHLQYRFRGRCQFNWLSGCFPTCEKGGWDSLLTFEGSPEDLNLLHQHQVEQRSQLCWSCFSIYFLYLTSFFSASSNHLWKHFGFFFFHWNEASSDLKFLFKCIWFALFLKFRHVFYFSGLN